MNTNTTSRTTQRRGNTLILVLVTLALLVMVGTALLQASRQDRDATVQLGRAGNIERVAELELNRVLKAIGDDLAQVVDGSEPHDYPHENVDAWLANFAPRFEGSDLVWPHITNIANNQWVHRTGGVTGHNVSLTPVDANAENESAELYEPFDPKFLIRNTDLVDVDGDGITDGRFVYAAMPIVDGTQYIAAVRVVDLSACINLNVATSLVSYSGGTVQSDAGAEAPRCRYLTDVDLGRFLFETKSAERIENAAGATALEEQVREFLRYRFGSPEPPTPSAPLPVLWIGEDHARTNFWNGGPRLYGNYNGMSGATTQYQRIGMDVERLLRVRNGLNSPDRDTAITMKSDGTTPHLRQLRRLLRDADPLGNKIDKEYRFDQIDQIDIGAPNDRNQIARYFAINDTELAVDNALDPNVPIFEPRHMLTTVSATGIHTAGYGAGLTHKLDLNNPALTPAEIRDRIVAVYRDHGAGDPVLPADFDVLLPDPLEAQEAFATQLAVNIKDYIDTDSRLSHLATTITGNNHYGLEPLPFVAEAFVQHSYRTDTGSSSLTTPPNTYDVIWTRQGGGFAIEIRNPFNYPISLDYVKVRIGGPAASVRELTTDLGSVDVLNPGEALLVYHEEGDSGGENILAAHAAELDAVDGVPDDSQHRLDWGSNPFSLGGDVTVELLAEAEDGNDIAYQIVTVDDVDDQAHAAGPIVQTGLNTAMAPWGGEDPTATNIWGYIHVSTIGTTEDLNLLAMRDADFDRSQHNVDPASTDPPLPIDDSIDSLGDPVAKTGTPNIGLTGTIDTSRYQLIFRNEDDTMWFPGELANIVILGPSEIAATTTIADAMHQVTGADDLETAFMLSFDPVLAGVMTNAGNTQVPHAMALLDQFTTLSPLSDGHDNDGDGSIDEPDELAVHGRININTAPRAVLYRALPIPDDTIRQSVVDALVDYRDDIASVQRNADTRPGANAFGIALLGETMGMVDVRDALLNDSIDTAALNGVPIDYRPDGSVDADGVADDREEQLLLMNWLGQITTTRSDVFAVYILVRGYELGDLTDQPGDADYVEEKMTEQLRILAIVDRSTIENIGDPPRVLALIRY